MTENKEQEDVELLVVDTLGFAVNTSSEVTTVLSLLNCGVGSLAWDYSESDFEELDSRIEIAESRLESFQYDWELFKEKYEKLKAQHEESNDD